MTAAQFGVESDRLFDVRGKNVLITGGSRGIGRMLAEGFVERGARVFISSRDEWACADTAQTLSGSGFCMPVPADVGTMEGLSTLADELKARCEGLDILVNNAGTVWASPIDDFPESGWDKSFNVNLKAAFFLTQKLLPMLRAAASPASPARVINVSSINGIVTPSQEGTEVYAYTASKAGLLMLTRHLARRLAHENILVNAIAPGPFDTKMLSATLAARKDDVLKATLLGRVGEADDIVGAVVFLGSRASGYMTGVTIPIDGGAMC